MYLVERSFFLPACEGELEDVEVGSPKLIIGLSYHVDQLWAVAGAAKSFQYQYVFDYCCMV